jgi:predicted transcriptional regulator
MDSTERLAIAQARVDLGYPLAEVLPDLGETPEDISRILQAAETARSNAGALAVAAFRAGQDPAAVLMG